MKIYLVRHGDSLASGDDNSRPLSEQGRADIERLATFIAPLQISVFQVWQSEKRRAQQTAEILTTSIQVIDSIETTPALEPLAWVDPIVTPLYANKKDTLLVGHMPFMGRLLGKLIAGNPDKTVVSFKAGSIMCLELLDHEQWVIRWMLDPELFRVPSRDR